jgi:hypothetical protein
MALMGSCSQQQKTVLLRFKHEPGLSESFEWSAKRHWKKMQGDSLINEGTYVVEATIDREVRRVLPDSTGEIVQNSTWIILRPSEDDSLVTDTVTGDRTLTFYTKPDGRLVDIEFPEDFGKEIDTSYYRTFYEQAATVFPNRPVKQGETWTHRSMVLLKDEQVEAFTDYTLRSFAREKGFDCAVIDFEGEMVVPINQSPDDTTKRHGVDRTKITGMMYFAYTEGTIISSRERLIQTFDRTYLKNGEWVNYLEVVEADGDFHLVSRE